MGMGTLRRRYEEEKAPKEEVVEIAEAEEVKEEVVEEVVEIADEYYSMTVTQLKAIAKERGIEEYSNLKKAELIERLENS